MENKVTSAFPRVSASSCRGKRWRMAVSLPSRSVNRSPWVSLGQSGLKTDVTEVEGIKVGLVGYPADGTRDTNLIDEEFLDEVRYKRNTWTGLQSSSSPSMGVRPRSSTNSSTPKPRLFLCWGRLTRL